MQNEEITIVDEIKVEDCKDFFYNKNKLYILSNRNSIWVRGEECSLQFTDEIFLTIIRENFMYVLHKNTQIIAIDLSDFTIVSVYKGIYKHAKHIQYTEDFIFMVTDDNLMYKSLFCEISWSEVTPNILNKKSTDVLDTVDSYKKLEHKNNSIYADVFFVDEENKILYSDLQGNIYYNWKKILSIFCDIFYLYKKNDEIFAVIENGIIFCNIKKPWASFKIPLRNFKTGYKEFVLTDTNIYDLKKKISYKSISNATKVKVFDDVFYLSAGNCIYLAKRCN